MKILLLEDDVKLSAGIEHFLASENFCCETVADGERFMVHSMSKLYVLYILDINVPNLNGMDVCRKVRLLDMRTPILMLTAYSNVEIKVEALDAGADDYLVKPFHLDELLARIKALLRRSSSAANGVPQIFLMADLRIDLAEKKVWRANKEIALTPKEFKLLEVLAKAGGKTLSKQTISEQVWDINFETGTNTIEVYISFLRNKIDKAFGRSLIHTRPGFGYYLKDTI
ncbi:MAG: response regulator transcription factor [Bacteroidota bacterium]|nr:response regulator transcription factor [Bacteroidota bacterium]